MRNKTNEGQLDRLRITTKSSLTVTTKDKSSKVTSLVVETSKVGDV